MRPGEGQMHLRHEHVGVVARVADDRRAFDVAQHVGVVGAEQQLRGVVAAKKVGMADRSVAVQAFEVQLR